MLFNEYKVLDEYDPLKPNDYQIEWAKREVQRRIAKQEARRQEVEARRRLNLFPALVPLLWARCLVSCSVLPQYFRF